MNKITKWWDEFVYGKSSVETVKAKRQYKPDRSMPEQPYDEIEEDRIAHDKVEEVFWYCTDRYENNPSNNGLIYHKTTLEILESEGGRDLLFRHNRYKRNLYKGTILFARPFFWHQTADQMNEYLDALGKEKSIEVNPVLDLSKQKFEIGEKVIATYHAYCTGVIIKRTTRKEHHFSRESDGKVWWWKVRVHESLGDRNHWGIIEVPECCLSDLKEYVERERARAEEPFYKEQMNDPQQRGAGLKLAFALRRAESFLTS